MTANKIDLAALRAKILASRAAQSSAPTIETTSPISISPITPPSTVSAPTTISITTSYVANLRTGVDRFGNTIQYNKQQSEFISLAATGKSCALIGAAGTGKTTTQRAAIQELIQSGHVPPLGTHDHKHLPETSGTLGIVICAFTRRATNNIRKNLSEDLQGNCVTIHKLLEYQPVETISVDPETGKETKSKPFLATRHAANPLPPTIKTIIIEEASMVSTKLYQELIDACPHKPQFIFLGDIQQLPPVFGAAILGFALSALPVVELTEVYRQALESPILSLAHRILSGNPIKSTELESFHQPERGLIIHPWKKKISADIATTTLASLFVKLYNAGEYNPDADGILIPFNKACGTIELNAHIANAIARKERRVTYHIIHGFLSSYYSCGDKVLYDKEDAIIQEIYPNPLYLGKQPSREGTNLNYWGHYFSLDDIDAVPLEIAEMDANSSDDVDDILKSVISSEYTGDEEERSRAASHKVTLYFPESDRTLTISSAGDFGKLDLGYAITVHKSQGSEWSKVFLCLHQSHATMLQRELLYTAVTRAKDMLTIICERDTFDKGILGQRIKGNTLQEKAELFKGKYDDSEQPIFW